MASARQRYSAKSAKSCSYPLTAFSLFPSRHALRIVSAVWARPAAIVRGAGRLPRASHFRMRPRRKWDPGCAVRRAVEWRESSAVTDSPAREAARGDSWVAHIVLNRLISCAVPCNTASHVVRALSASILFFTFMDCSTIRRPKRCTA